MFVLFLRSFTSPKLFDRYLVLNLCTFLKTKYKSENYYMNSFCEIVNCPIVHDVQIY